MRTSTSIALGIFVTLGSIAQTAQALTHQSELLIPKYPANLQAQVIMNKPADSNNNNQPPANNQPPENNPPPANNPPPKKDPPHPPSFGINPWPIDRPRFAAGSTPDVAPGFRPQTTVIFTNYYYDNGRWSNTPKSKTRIVCSKGYRVVRGSICQRANTQATKK